MRLSMKFCIKEFPRQFLSKRKIAILNSTLLEKNEKERKVTWITPLCHILILDLLI